MADDRTFDPETEWLRHVQPEGLVVAPMVLKALGPPPRQDQTHNVAVAALLSKNSDGTINDEGPALGAPWAFFSSILNWPPDMVAGAPGGPPLDDQLELALPEHDTLLKPDWAVKAAAGTEGWQLLVRIEKAGIDPDKRGALDGWEAAPIQRFERLLRETKVETGVLVSDKEIRLVHAPRGETSGWISWPIRPLATVAGRPMLGGLKLLLDVFCLFNDAEPSRLPALLKASRDAQAEVSTKLAEQVLGALHELLRGLTAADGARIAKLCETRHDHLYEGLLTVLLRLVFILYAEDRNLLPSLQTEKAKRVYEASYALRSLYARLLEDQALNPDTMDERRGGWGRLLALFRLIHGGHSSGFIQKRGGKLFDPDAFPFLEGRDTASDPPQIQPVSDGCVLRILEGLMAIGGAKGQARERLSYKTLDVEQIGSVYEIVMGFRAEVARAPSLALKVKPNSKSKAFVPVFVDLEGLLGAKADQRLKVLKEEYGYDEKNAKRDTALKTARTIEELAAALDAVVDERASPGKRIAIKGMPILQPTDERRRTGSHYTPRSITAPIVEHALEPAFERLGPNATPEQVLDLKVCDPAMGSGAFLVEACRALATKLVESWGTHKDKKPLIPPDEDEELHARRLVAQRCLYGVDKNPLATDLAKLSLWLATLARDHEFTFLDHALKSGDSLVGLTQAQIAAAHWDTSKPGLPLFRQLVKQRVAEAMKGRAEIQAAPDDTARAIQEQRHNSLEARIKDIRLMGDAVIATFFAEGKPKARERRRAEVESWLTGSMEAAWDKLAAMAATLKQGAHPLTPFHWQIEFPEVFTGNNGGFDAIVGNPPFLGGSRISSELGESYLRYLLSSFATAGDKTDLVLYFFARASHLLKKRGIAGLVATNTISQGDSRSSLRILGQEAFRIFRAKRRLPWPGDATVVVSILHLSKDVDRHPKFLDDRKAEKISVYLKESNIDDDPMPLSGNIGLAYEGFGPYGAGFILNVGDTESDSIMADSHYQPIIFDYVGGDDILNSSTGNSDRKIIYIGKMERAEFERRYPKAYQLIERTVKGERAKKSRRVAAMPWWQFLWPRPELKAKMNQLQQVLVRPRVAKHHAFMQRPANWIISNSANVICTERLSPFAALQCRAHEIWTRFFASTLEDRLRYTPSDCFETFPFPQALESSAVLEAAGRAYHDHRAALMVARNEGMTKTYNRFHDRSETSEDIARLRELHAAMDRAVLEAYGWHDLAARAAPVFLDEINEDDHTYQGRLFWPSDFRDEVLARLLALNAERHAEEVRLGIAPGMKGRVDEEAETEEE